MLASPHLFWAILAVVLSLLLLAVGWLAFKAVRRLRRIRGPASTRLPLHTAKDAPQDQLGSKAIADIEAQCLSPASKAWAEGHERIWVEEAERINTMQPIPWLVYVPKEPIVAGAASEAVEANEAGAVSRTTATIAFPQPVYIKDTPPRMASNAPPSKAVADDKGFPQSSYVLPSPQVAETSVLDTIAEEDEEILGRQDSVDSTKLAPISRFSEDSLCSQAIPPTPALSSCFSDDSLGSQDDSTDILLPDVIVSALLAPVPKADLGNASSVPQIVLTTCPSLPLPGASTVDDGLAALSAALGGTFLRIPDDDDDVVAPSKRDVRPVLGTVSRNTSRRRALATTKDGRLPAGGQLGTEAVRRQENARPRWR